MIDIYLFLVLGVMFDFCGFVFLFVVDFFRFVYFFLYFYFIVGVIFLVINFVGWSVWVIYVFGEEFLVVFINNIVLFFCVDYYFKIVFVNVLIFLFVVGNDYLVFK